MKNYHYQSYPLYGIINQCFVKNVKPEAKICRDETLL